MNERSNALARRTLLALSVGGTAAILCGCGASSSGSYRFKLTVEVETPQGLRTGSSIMQVSAYRTLGLTAEEKAGGGGLRGEAVSVELPDGPLFVTLKTPEAGEGLDAATTFALAPDTKRGNVDAYIGAVRNLGGWFAGIRKAALPRANWPVMVRFRDLNNSASVEKVDPDAIGVKRIMIETTNANVTSGIEHRLVWLPSHNGAIAYDGRMHPNQPEKDLNQSAFSTELNK